MIPMEQTYNKRSTVKYNVLILKYNFHIIIFSNRNNFANYILKLIIV